MILTIRPATLEDAHYIGAHLRPEDEREVLTVTGLPGDMAVPSSFRASQECYTIRFSTRYGTVEEPPVVIFGLTGVSTIWLLSTPEVTRAPLSVLREARHWVDHWARREGVVQNLVDNRNDLHIRWIQLLGFTLGDTYDVRGHPFRHFYKERQ